MVTSAGLEAADNATSIQIHRPDSVVTDCSKELLEAPESLEDSKTFTVAKTPPTLHFSVAKGCRPISKDSHGVWSSWSESIYASDGNFYTAYGSHQGVDGLTYIARYNPKTGEQNLVFDSDICLSHKPGTYGHGKIHGRLDEYPKGYLIAATYWGIPPLDSYYKGEFWTGAIPGGHLLRVDIEKGITEDLGAPFERDSWPMFATDTKRGIFYAVGYDKHFLAYDLDAMRPIYAALPPPNIEWGARATLVDEETGNCYTTSRGLFAKYDRRTNEITHLKTLDAGQSKWKRQADQYALLYPAPDRRGMLSRSNHGRCAIQVLFPDTETVEYVGINWDEGVYCASMALSPGDRYLYYTVDVHGSAFKHGSPVVQYDLVKNQQKVLAFLHPYYHEKYGYALGGSFAVCLNDDGSQLFITWNGKFSVDVEGESFGDPSFMLIDIPASERIE